MTETRSEAFKELQPVLDQYAGVKGSLITILQKAQAIYGYLSKDCINYISEQTGIKPRVSITGYNKTFINEATAIVASVTLVSYIMYTMSEEVIARLGTRYVYLTSGWVLAGLLRYLQNMIVYGLSGSPTKSLVKDHFVQLCIAGWILSFFAIIYL